ncbi:hypothetical protein RP20_CCG002826 [Aedes albopictus]|nr:hypothetical protein RP20_CCG002826 [Aedes albopictus]
MRQEHMELECPTSATHFITEAANMHYCQQRLQRLGSTLLRAFNNQDIAELRRCQTKYYHYRARISLIRDPLYVPYTVQAEKVINESLDQIAEFLQSLTSVSPPEFSQEEILPEEQDVLDELRNSRFQSSVKETANREVQKQNQVTSAPVNLSHKIGTGAIPKTSVHQQAEGEPPRSPQRPRDTDFPRMERPRIQPNPLPPLPPPRHSLGRNRDQYQLQHPPSASHQAADVRDEIIRYLLNNRHQTNEGIDQQAQTSGRSTPNHRHRFTQPVHKWPFSYGGNENIMELAVFLNRVKTYADTEDIDEFSLLRGIKHLLRGRALEWYTRSYNRFSTWAEFKQQIKAEFLPPNFSQLIKRDLYWRFQGQDETFSKYYHDLLALFEVLEPSLSAQDQFFILKSNLNTEFAAVASASRAFSVGDLVEVCKDYDHAKMFSQKNKTSQIPRTALIEPNRGTPIYPRVSRPGVSGYSWNRAALQPNRTPQVNVIEEEELDVNPQALMLQDANQAYDQEETTTLTTVEPLEEQVNAVRTQGAWGQGDQALDVRRKSLAITCWQCEQNGHAFTACRSPKTFLFCYRCGKKGFTSRNCTDCLARMSQALPDGMITSTQGNANTGFQK